LLTLLSGQGWQVEQVDHSGSLEKFLEDRQVLVVICEANLPDSDPTVILRACARHETPVIFLGHDSQVQLAVDLIRQGAYDYLEKPFSRERLFDLLNHLPSRQNSRHNTSI
jgi:DNA-binding NtrC family response regulator